MYTKSSQHTICRSIEFTSDNRWRKGDETIQLHFDIQISEQKLNHETFFCVEVYMNEEKSVTHDGC